MSKKIRLIPLKCKIPNLALMKLSAWHKSQGDHVSLDEPEPDVVYISSPFSSANQHIDHAQMFPDAKIEYGGYGFNDKQLPQEIEHIMPDYSIFNCSYSMGYTTRGCIRSCKKPPCIVPKMEGNTRRNSPIEEFHDPSHKKVMLLDNNILADESWFFRNATYIIDNKLILIEHGFDIRLVDEDIAKLISEIRFDKQIHFAFDSFDYVGMLNKGIYFLEQAGIKPYRLMFYLYEKDDLENLIKRFEMINAFRCDPFIMPDVNATKDIKHFARFVNKRIYKVCEWSDYGRI